MSIATKAELRTEVRSILEEDSVILTDAVLNNRILLAENKINRSAGAVREAWTTSTALVGSASSRELSLPSNFVEPLWLKLTTFDAGGAKLTKRTDRTMEYLTGNGSPSEWCIRGSKIDLNVPCDQAHTFAFRYRAKFFLDVDGDSNWLLLQHPDVYLYGTLYHAALFTEHSDLAGGMKGLFEQALDDVNWIERKSSVSSLVVDPGLAASSGGYDVYNDQ